MACPFLAYTAPHRTAPIPLSPNTPLPPVQLVLELLELRELDTARQVLRAAPPMVTLKERDAARHQKLESLAGRYVV